MSQWKTKEESTYWVRIHVAGDLQTIKQTCRQFCLEVGLCVNIQPCDYIYTGGEESGAVIELIHYPRFPVEDFRDIRNKARDLAYRVAEAACQHSVLVMTPEKTEWFTRRDDK
jgi:hypothetical protein